MQKIQDSTNCAVCPLKSSLFKALGAKETACVHRHKEEVLVQSGEQIVHRGQEITHFFYLQTGLVKLYSESESHREQIISISRPLDFIGLLTIFSDTHYQYSISAVLESRLCMIEVGCIETLVAQNGSFAIEVLKNMSIMTDHILKDSYNLRSLQMRGRIAYVLNFFAEDIFKSSGFELPLSRKEFGQMIGVSTENVIRILSEFRRDGLIRISGKSIDILNHAAVREIAIRG